MSALTTSLAVAGSQEGTKERRRLGAYSPRDASQAERDIDMPKMSLQVAKKIELRSLAIKDRMEDYCLEKTRHQ